MAHCFTCPGFSKIKIYRLPLAKLELDIVKQREEGRDARRKMNSRSTMIESFENRDTVECVSLVFF